MGLLAPMNASFLFWVSQSMFGVQVFGSSSLVPGLLLTMNVCNILRPHLLMLFLKSFFVAWMLLCVYMPPRLRIQQFLCTPSFLFRRSARKLYPNTEYIDNVALRAADEGFP